MAPSFDLLSSSPYMPSTSLSLEQHDTKENLDIGGLLDTTNSRKVSQNTTISSIPPSVLDTALPQAIHREKRPPFRSPSSVRALQLSEREPSLHNDSAKSLREEFRRQKWSLGAVRNLRPSVHEDSDVSDDDSPDVQYGDDGDGMVLQRMMAQKRQECKAKKYRRPGLPTLDRTISATSTVDTMLHPQYNQAPLVLLHITVLPSTINYSSTVLERVAPEYVQHNLALLKDKLNDNVFARGMLVPHPGEEYDLLEERLLEALELCIPRVTACGHFLGDEDDSFLDAGMQSAPTEHEHCNGESVEIHAICDVAHADTKGSSIRSHGSDLCETCRAPMRSPIRGAGSGNKRWEINFYAANGLMRAGAWSAAWREMERVDVDIAPWMPPEVKRALELAQRQEATKLAAATADLEHAKRQIQVLEDDVVRMHDELQINRAALLQRDAFKSPGQQAETPQRHGSIAEMSHSSSKYDDDVPLSRLLKRYLLLLAQDKRNIAIAILSLVVAVFSFYLAPVSPSAMPISLPAIDTTPTTKLATLTPVSSSTGTATAPLLVSISVDSSSVQTPSSTRRRWF